MIKEFIYNQLNKILLVIILVLIVLILCSNNNSFKGKIVFNLYENNLSFMSFKQLYDKYFGGIYYFKNHSDKDYMVFNSNLLYDNYEKYYDGIKLAVSNNYLVPSVDEGRIIFIGEKENFGNTIIIQTKNNINIWYGNIINSSLKLYDYIDKGEYLGEANGDYFYIAYSSGNKMINSSKYIKN